MMSDTIAVGKKLLGRYSVRAMARGDLKTVESIEKTSPENSWNAADFRKTIASKGVQGRVVVENGNIIAFYVYEYEEEQRGIHILDFVIHPDHRRQGLGTAMMGVLRNRLSDTHTVLKSDIRESNLTGQLFLRKNNFKAIKVERRYFVDYNVYGESRSEDAYCFSYAGESK